MKNGERYTVRPIRIAGATAYVELTKGYTATIDAADIPLIAGRNWYAQVTPTSVYAARSEIVDGIQRCVLMHRVIAGAGEPEVDHRDLNGLNNRRKNLRVATRSQNLANRGANMNSTLGIKGVRRMRGKFIAEIETGGRSYYLGSYGTAELAAAAYAGAARVLFGEFARSTRKAQPHAR